MIGWPCCFGAVERQHIIVGASGGENYYFLGHEAKENKKGPGLQTLHDMQISHLALSPKDSSISHRHCPLGTSNIWISGEHLQYQLRRN